MNNSHEFYWPAASGFHRGHRNVCKPRMGAVDKRGRDVEWCEGPHPVFGHEDHGPRCAVPA